MADVLLLLTLLVVVGALLALVRLCDRIVGDDPPTRAPATTDASASALAGSTSNEVSP
jgi:hypothetical protein